MLNILIENLIKPFTGLILIIRLFTAADSEDGVPLISALQLVTQNDSVFVKVDLRNGLTQEIEDLIIYGTMIKTTTRFSCDTIAKIWNRIYIYHPIKEFVCVDPVNELCAQQFNLDELDKRFNTLSLYIGSRSQIRSMKKRNAKVTVNVSTEIDVYEMGTKDLWPKSISEEFVVPELL